VRYVLGRAEIPAFEEAPSIDANGDGVLSPAEQQAWADRTGARIGSNRAVTVGGAPVLLRTVAAAFSYRPGQAGLPTLRLVVEFDGELPSGGALAFRDRNFPDRIGWKEITARATQGVVLDAPSIPTSSVSDELLHYPVDLLSSPLDVSEATLAFHDDPAAPGTAGGARGRPSGETVSGAPIASGGSFANLVTWRLTPLVLAVSVLLAMGFGALHALGPGHGKTITAAYLVGKGGRAREAATVGIAVALMHTASVLTLGLVLFVLSRSFPAQKVYPWLTVATGAVALGLGAALLVTRVGGVRRGRDQDDHHEHQVHRQHHEHAWISVGNGDPTGPRQRTLGGLRTGEEGPVPTGAGDVPAGSSSDPGAVDGVASAPGAVRLLEREESGQHDSAPGADHPTTRPHGHPHEHRHPHHHDLPPKPLSPKGLLALAVAGGILPSPTAFVVLTGAVTAHRVGYGLALVAAFSVGLAGALMGVGMLAVRARAVVSARLGGRLGAMLPILSAAVIVGFGLFFVVRGSAQI